MVNIWLWGGVALILLYTAVPWVLTRIFAIGIFRRGTGVERKIALTFDDGPDPLYTPRLLDLLKEQRVRATFFVLGSKAEKYPDLIARIHREGHQIGIHNYSHLSNWLMTPWTVRNKQVEATAAVVERATGCKPTFYRPPWGILNLFDLVLLRSYRIVLWSRMPRDWSSRIGATKLQDRLIKRVRSGDVVLLHDSGETYGADRDAPSYTILALEPLIEKMRGEGIECVRVDEMAGETPPRRAGRMSAGKKLVVAGWMSWEWCFERMFHLEPIDHSNPILKLRIRKYRGNNPLTLADGERIEQGDRIAELHFDNELLFEIGAVSKSPVQLAIQMIRRVELLLPQVRQLLIADPKFKDVKGLYGISMIHRGAVRLGFTVIGLPQGIFSLATGLYLRLLMYAVHPHGKERLKRKPEQLTPKIIAMSRKELLNRYSA